MLYVPELDQNLLSVSQMMRNGYSLHFEGSTCDIYDPHKRHVASVEVKNKFFPIQWNYPAETSLKAQIEPINWLWHKRFGRCSVNSLIQLSQKCLVKDLPTIENFTGVCEGCQMGEMQRKPFPASTSWRATQKLQLVHTDVRGPMRTPSLDNSRYFILFIGDFSRMTWLFL